MGPLSDYRVLDLTDEKGMFCAKLLSDMGADVIRIENPDDKANRQSPVFCYLNAGKRAVSLNLEDGRGQELFKRLVKTASVLVESVEPGYLASLSLGYSELSRINPGLVMASITSFGQSGPYKNYKACDLAVSALSGQMSVSGEETPLKPFGDQTYYTACLFAANGILLALWHRHETGKGQYIDVSAMESAAATLDHILVRYFGEGVVAKRQGSRYWNDAFRIFPCRDGYILLTLFHQWETLVEWLDSEGMAEGLTDKKWLDRETRERNFNHIVGVLERWTRCHTVAELVEKGQLMRFPWAEVTSMSRLMNSPQLASRQFFISGECGDSGKIFMYPGIPCQLSGSPWEAGGRVARHGEHNREVYHNELGLSTVEIEALSQQGVI